MTLLSLHVRVQLLNFARQHSFMVGTLVLPSLFFLFFAAPNADTPEKARLLMASFTAFAVLGVVFFQFGLDFAQERNTPWHQYLRTLPVPTWLFLAARSITALLFALLAATVVVLIALISTPATLSLSEFLHLNSVLIAGSLPFSMFGLCIGYFVPASSALPVTNLVYLILSFAGGLWIPPAGLSAPIQRVSEWLPTRFYAEWAWSVVLKTGFPAWQVAGLFAYFAIITPLVYLGHRRIA